MAAVQLVVSMALLSSINATVISVYPCVWRDEITGAQLDLQVFQSMVLYNYTRSMYSPGKVTYSPCSNSISYNGESYMVVFNDAYTQPVVKWDNGITVPAYDSSTGNWHFFYNDTNIECVSNHSQQMSLSITWSYGDLNNINSIGPNITNFNQYSGGCSVSFNTQSVSTYNDDCILPLYSVYSNNHQPYISGHVNLSVFNSYIFDAKIGSTIHSNQHILYSPCNDAIKCDSNLAQAVITDFNQTNCTYLSLFAGYGLAYAHTSRSNPYYKYWNYNQYYDFNANTDTQTISILYKTGANCSVSESETMERTFYVYWQCNTLAKPYGNVQTTSDVVCTETLSIDSIYACPDFQECIYYDQDNMFNFTQLIGKYFAIQDSKNLSSWFYYSVCQNGLSNTMNPVSIDQPTTLYNKLNFMSAIYSGPQTIGDNNNFVMTAIASRFAVTKDTTKYYYDSEINAWIFQYTNGNLCPMDSLFTVQWNCGFKSTHFVSYTNTPCAVALVINTNLC